MAELGDFEVRLTGGGFRVKVAMSEISKSDLIIKPTTYTCSIKRSASVGR